MGSAARGGALCNFFQFDIERSIENPSQSLTTGIIIAALKLVTVQTHSLFMKFAEIAVFAEDVIKSAIKDQINGK
jgi:hypothetical protein